MGLTLHEYINLLIARGRIPVYSFRIHAYDSYKQDGAMTSNCSREKGNHWLPYYLHHPSTKLAPLCLQSCLNSSGHGSSWVLEIFLREFGSYLVHTVAAYLSAPHPWCQSPIRPHPKGALRVGLMTVEVIWGRKTNCHVQETSSHSDARF